MHNSSKIKNHSIKLIAFSAFMLVAFVMFPNLRTDTISNATVNVSDEIFKVQTDSSIAIKNEEQNFNLENTEVEEDSELEDSKDSSLK